MDEELDLKRAVAKAKKSFWRKTDKGSKFLTRKEARKQARQNKKSKRAGKISKETDVTQEIMVEKGTDKIKKKKKKNKGKKQESTDTTKEEIQNYPNEEDKMIASMEKKLKMKKKKNLPSVFAEDGLDYLLDVCEPFMDREENADDEYRKRKRELALEKSNGSKKRKVDPTESVSGAEDLDTDEEEFDEGDSELDVSENEYVGKRKEDNRGLPNGSPVANVCEEENDDVEEQRDLDKNKDILKDSKDEEIEGTKGTSAKYIPPHLRETDNSAAHRAQVLERIRKQLKGNINRLSEANLHSIARGVEEIYATNSRNDVNETVCQLIMDACITPNNMPPRLSMEHIMLIAVLNETVGNEVGAKLVQILAEKFNKLHQMEGSYGEGKECNNTLLLLAHMYNFKVIDALLLTDVMQELVNNFKEEDIEMLLLLLKTIGAQIRRDDPAALKELILTIQAKAVTQVVETDRSRVKFMLEILTALRNNNLRKIPQYDPDIVDHARKVVRQILKGKEGSSQLRISLKDLLDAGDKGRWWIVGSAWSGTIPNEEKNMEHLTQMAPLEDNLIALAKQQRMTTDVKKNIFCVMMSSEDYLDAFEKLLKLNLKEKQAREIVHVLVDCCLQEKTYNPFYALLGQKLCEFDKSHKITFQYSFWDRFKLLSSTKKHSRHNLASLIAYLLASHSISLSVLKVVSFGTIDKTSINFFKELFSILILKNRERVVRPVFLRIASQPKLSLLKEGIKIFLEYFLMPRQGSNSSDVPSSDIGRTKDMIEIAIASLDGNE